jgi:hypothetical protein
MSCERCSALKGRSAPWRQVKEQTLIRDSRFPSPEQEHEFQERLEKKVTLLRQAQVIYRNHLVRVHHAG